MRSITALSKAATERILFYFIKNRSNGAFLTEAVKILRVSDLQKFSEIFKKVVAILNKTQTIRRNLSTKLKSVKLTF
jgi:hypothetical protein